jgi:hypothetical protein
VAGCWEKTIVPSGSKNGKEFLVYLTGLEIKVWQVYSQWTGIVIIVFIIILRAESFLEC